MAENNAPPFKFGPAQKALFGSIFPFCMAVCLICQIRGTIIVINQRFFASIIGTPPNCNLCVEPCYNNWNNYVSQEVSTLANLMSNTSSLLALFGSTSYSQTSTQLQILNDNLTYASRVYEGAQYDTRSKETQFQQVWGF